MVVLVFFTDVMVFFVVVHEEGVEWPEWPEGVEGAGGHGRGRASTGGRGRGRAGRVF